MTVSEIMVKMVKYSKGNLHDINHFMKVSRPRQHGHLKRKDSIRFLVFLDFSLIFIRSG